jgi:hypothetical protein|tara:strand:+ start:471 stop:776 length:306 start_codon:yes stop_codon:yes gene_type:complete
MNLVFKHPSKYPKDNRVPIKKAKVGKKYRLEEHEHTVMEYDYNYSYMTGTCVTNQKTKDDHLIEIKLDFPRKELQGEYGNKLMFYFPHDEQYEDVLLVPLP